MGSKRMTAAEGRARRERYLELRRGGMPRWEAVAAVGGLDSATANNYEHWFLAEQGKPVRLPDPAGWWKGKR